MLEFKTEKLSFKLNGQPYEVRYPYMHELKKFNKVMDEEGKNELDAIDWLFSELGMPSEVMQQLHSDHIYELALALSGQKKR